MKKVKARGGDKKLDHKRGQAIIYQLLPAGSEDQPSEIPPLSVQSWHCHKVARDLGLEVCGLLADEEDAQDRWDTLVATIARVRKSRHVDWIIVYSPALLAGDVLSALAVGWEAGAAHVQFLYAVPEEDRLRSHIRWAQ